VTAAATAESLSVGIVTYNHAHVLARTLESILRELPAGLPSSVWVVDNRSSDESLAIARRFAADDGRLSIIENRSNVGFSRANNQILRSVDSTFHIFCNPDIMVTNGAVMTLIDFLRAQPDVAIVCPRVHFEDGRLQPLNKRSPTVWDLFLRRFMLSPLQKLFEDRMRRYDMHDMGYDRSYDVPFVSGAFMVCRTAVLKAAGGFDERFFAYMEDADLSRRIQEAGWRTSYCPDATIIHTWNREAHRTYRGTLLFCASVVRYFNKWGWRLL
jgi:GT2 family glycosyltransferase